MWDDIILHARNKVVKAILIAAAVVVATGISLAYMIDQINRYGEVPCPAEVATLDSYKASATAVGFTRLEEIVANSDAIIIADVERCVKVHSHPKDKEIRLTDIELAIGKVIIGEVQAGSSVTVQLVTSGEDADHLMQPGERYLLFLTFNRITSSYVPVGGPQGRFVIVDERAYSLDRIDPNLDYINVKMDGMPLDDLVAQLHAMTGQT
jgi:hypothetical protein